MSINPFKLRRAAPYAFIAPFLIIFLTFGLFPIVFSLYLVFHSWDPVQGLQSMEYVGSDNIAFAIEDPWLWQSLGNTLWLGVASGLPQHCIAIPLAWLINEKLGRWRDTAMGVYFLPYITSTVAVAMMFITLFSTDYGVANVMLTSLAQMPILEWFFPTDNIDWLGQPETIKPVIAFVVFWRFLGFNTILYVAAMQAIPRELYEAARMDGAKEWHIFWHITVPQIKPMMYFGVILSIIGGLQLFEEPFILTNGKGGIEQSGLTTALYMFRTAFEYNDFGLASTIAWILFIVIVIITLITNRAFKDKRGSI